MRVGPGIFSVLDNGKAIFSASDATHGEELWITDGTASGTKLLKDIAPDPNLAGGSPRDFTALGNGKVLFIANRELWITDGTKAGTRLVKDIDGGHQDPLIQYTVVGGGKAIFTAASRNTTRKFGSRRDGRRHETAEKSIRISDGGSSPDDYTPVGSPIPAKVTNVSARGPDVTAGSGTLTVGETATLTLTLSEGVKLSSSSKLSLALNDGGEEDMTLTLLRRQLSSSVMSCRSIRAHRISLLRPLE